MTDQTVPVPIDLLKKAEAYYRDYPSARRGPLAAIFALIPAPPKVGDVLTEEQIKALPPKSVLRDNDNDLWIVGEKGIVHLITFKREGGLTDDEQYGYDAIEYSPVLVSLPAGE